MTDPDPRFGELSEAERALLEAAATGAWADVRAAGTDADRRVRAGLLAELLTGGRTSETGRPRSVKLRGARVTGVLDLEAAELACPLLLADTRFEEPVVLSEATAPSLRLPGCHVPALLADQLRTTGNLELNRGFTAARIHLMGADIGGTVDLTDAALSNPGAPALLAEGLTVAQNMICRNLTAEGETRLSAARVGGVLTLDGATLSNPHGAALTADGLTVEQSMSCRDGFTAHGEVHLRGAAVNGTLALDGARLDAPGADALAAARLTVGHDAFCRDLSAEGEVRLPGARIGGRLDLSRARLSNPGAAALTADRLTVDDGVLAEGMTCDGEVRLPGARIGGTLVLAGARLSNPGALALDGDGLVVDQDVQAGGLTVAGETRLVRARVGGALNLDGAALTDPGRTALSADALIVEQSAYCRGLTAEGEIRLIGARIGGVADFTGARLANPGRRALYAVRLTVEGDLMLRRGFTAEGGLQLSGARVGGQIEIADAVLTRPRRQALDLTAATAQELVLRPRQTPEGRVNLTNAQVGIFEDDRRTWPDDLLLQGFAYDALSGGDADVRARLRWASRHGGGYTPQIYDQLAAAYRRTGHEASARRVAIAKQWHRRKVLSPPGKLTNWLLYLTVGYGYRTWLAAIWLAALLALGTQLFDADQMARAATTAPSFNAFGYTLDVLLPIGDLGQQKSWQPTGAAQFWTWTFMAAGWILSTAVIAGLTGILRRD
ncbi:hypothetical protein [Actinomadura sp. GTD37]|uniref:hypothetical protein n=1 Tax=Actinomadura sp. GTD37 TaxID=1778030 RepID=UPI0035BF72A1